MRLKTTNGLEISSKHLFLKSFLVKVRSSQSEEISLKMEALRVFLFYNSVLGAMQGVNCCIVGFEEVLSFSYFASLFNQNRSPARSIHHSITLLWHSKSGSIRVHQLNCIRRLKWKSHFTFLYGTFRNESWPLFGVSWFWHRDMQSVDYIAHLFALHFDFDTMSKKSFTSVCFHGYHSFFCHGAHRYYSNALKVTGNVNISLLFKSTYRYCTIHICTLIAK